MMMATLETLMAVRDPGPLSEIYTIPGTCLTIHISGISNRYQRMVLIQKRADVLIAMGNIVFPDGSQKPMVPADLEVAAYLSACVIDPVVPVLEWAKFLYYNPSLVVPLRKRCLVACRIEADVVAAVTDGVDAALGELLGVVDGNGDKVSPLDPFVLMSSSSA